VKTKFSHPCPRNTQLVKLCNSWDDSDTAGNSLEKSFSVIPHSNIILLWMSGMSANLRPIRGILLNFGMSQNSQEAKSSEWCGWSIFVCNGLLRQEPLTHHAQGHCHCGESACQARLWGMSSEQIPVPPPAISLTPNLRSECTKGRTLFTFTSVL
jgi:hypothetical protein